MSRESHVVWVESEILELSFLTGAVGKRMEVCDAEQMKYESEPVLSSKVPAGL